MWKVKNPILTDANRTETMQIPDLNRTSIGKDNAGTSEKQEISDENSLSPIESQEAGKNKPKESEAKIFGGEKIEDVGEKIGGARKDIRRIQDSR